MEWGSALRMKCMPMCYHFSHVRLFGTQWTEAHQAALSMEFFRQDTGIGCHALCQGIFPIWGSSLSSDQTHVSYVTCIDRWILYH